MKLKGDEKKNLLLVAAIYDPRLLQLNGGREPQQEK